jgi:hypothetical protein
MYFITDERIDRDVLLKCDKTDAVLCIVRLFGDISGVRIFNAIFYILIYLVCTYILSSNMITLITTTLKIILSPRKFRLT